MSAKTIKTALGLLQDDPESPQAWQELRDELGRRDPEMPSDELARLLESARRAHDARREYEAVARLFAIEVEAAEGTPRQAELLSEWARVLDEELLDDEAANDVYGRLLALRPDDAEAAEARDRSAAKRGKWRELVERFVQEAARASDPAFRSSLLVSAAEATYRFGRRAERASSVDRIAELLREALRLDPKNRRGETLLERLLREEGRWSDLAASIERFAAEATQKEERVAAWVRLGRVLARRLDARDRAAAAYERVLELAPGHAEASSFLADHFTATGQWDRLVALYESQLSAGALRGKDEEFGATLQIAMVHWRMRGRPDAAEPWFEKLRLLQPAHPGMLAFFREWCSARGESHRLAAILTDAQRALADGPERSALAAEIAKLAEEGANAQKAIEQWRTLLRQDPRNRDAIEALKRLYRRTASYSALTDLLRQELERISVDDAAARLVVLREIAGIYREHVKSDSALVTILSQILALDAQDLDSIRELARVYESLQRWRDLVAIQARQAELEPDAAVRAALWRAVARRWLDQFSNVQNAIDAYEKLHRVEPRDNEAVERLRELYAKRRAYGSLYELLRDQAGAMDAGPARREVWMEMAKIAAERLDLGAEATALYKRVLDEEPATVPALDALEKLAERDKDYATVADALERRATVAPDDNARVAVLQKLGSVYADRLNDTTRAMGAWRRVLAIAPGHGKAVRVLRDALLATGDYDGLAELYARGGDWEGLADVLSSAAERASDPGLKVDLSFRAARVYEQNLRAPERAFRAYERVLAVLPSDARAASALVPLYEREEKWARLPALYEIQLGHAEDVGEKLALLDKLVDVTGAKLDDPVAAFGWATRSYELAPERPGALDAFERAARAARQWPGFVDALGARLRAIDAAGPGAARPKKRKKRDQENGLPARGEERRALRAKLADVYAREMGRTDEAVQTYRALVDEDENDDASVQTLDRLLRATDRRDDLRSLFELRIERANTAHKIDLLTEWASLEENAFGSPENAVALFRRLLAIVPHHGAALRSLARLLRAQGDAHGAAEIIAVDRDQREGAERAAREIELAKLYADPLRRYGDALAASERALELVPNDPRAVATIEQLLPIAETRARAAAVLERAYDETGAYRQQAEVLEVLVATMAAREDRLRLLERLADVHERKLADAEAAFDVVARAATEYPSELALWDRLAGLAARTGRAGALAETIAQAVPPDQPTALPEAVELELADRAAVLYDEKLGDVDRAMPYLERMLSRQPGNERAFLRLKQILTTREQWADLGALYERTLAATRDASRRADLLAEIALVAEEITADRPRAIGYYERILDIEPAHEQAIRALDGLYAAEQRWDRLAGLLERRLQSARGDEKLDLQQRLGSLLFARLGDAAGALAYLEAVLRERPSAAEPRRIVESILDVPELRSRAAILLESVYTSGDAVPELVRVLEIHLEFATDADERRDLLRRIAHLRDERLHDDPGALEALARLLPLDPDDGLARERLLAIAQRVGASDRAAGVLAATAATAAAPQPRADILMDMARLYEQRMNDLARAEAVYREVLQLAPQDASIALPVCRALEPIYGRGDQKQLAEILRIEVALEGDSNARRELRGRLGDLCEGVLDDPRGAIEAWRARLDEDRGDLQALAALDRLFERTERWRELVDVLRARERSTDDPAARRELLTRIAATLAQRLGDGDEAIAAYRSVIDEFGADRPTLAALGGLFERAGRWRELAEGLEADLALADMPGDKLGILARLGEVRRQRLEDVHGALEAFRGALAIEPSHAPSRAALEGLLDEPTAKREAAAILRPLYEADAQHEKLLRVLEIEADHAESKQEKLDLIARGLTVAEASLGDPARALAYAAQGLREAVADPDLPSWIERAERLAGATARYPQLVTLLRSAVDEIVDPDLKLRVTLRIADTARQQLGDVALAREYYVRALDQRGDDPRALGALESLYEEIGDPAALLGVVRRRAELADTDTARRPLLFKQARLCDEKLGDAAGAIRVYEEILDMGLDGDAVAQLEKLYAREGRWSDLVALYERQIGAAEASPERRAALHHALGDVLERKTGDVDRAFDEYAAALAIDPKHPQTVASLESLMARREQSARAAAMLEPVYQARLDWRRVMATLEARLAVSQDAHERRQWLRRLSKLHEEQEENYPAALETTALLLSEEPTDEGTWAELERLARVAGSEARLAEIYATELDRIGADEPATARLARRTGELFEGHGQPERALTFYRRAYAYDPASGQASFDALDRLLKTAGRPADRVQLYRDALDYKVGPHERLAVLHVIARIQEGELHDEGAAIDTYRAALDIDDRDAVALDALGRLYADKERWHDLADLTRRRAEQSSSPGEEARFRLDLARLLVHKLGQPRAGLDELQTVIELVPDRTEVGAPAVVELEAILASPDYKARAIEILRPIYERRDDWPALVRLNEERLTIATDDRERVAVWRENAGLWERRGGDLARAFTATRAAWTHDPEDGAAREELERLAKATGQWDALADAYEEAIPRAEPLTKRELLTALARLHDERRDDPRRALGAWDRLFALDETDLEPLEHMDALATLLSDWRALVRVLSRKAELLADDEARATTWRRIGEARRDMLDEQDGAIDAYERALEFEPTSALTIDQLIELYERKNDASRLVDLYRRRVELCGEDEQEHRFQLLVVASMRYEADLLDRREAIACLRQALALKPGDAEVLRRLDILYRQERLWPELLENLKSQVDAAPDEPSRRALKKRIAALYALELQDPAAALESYRDVLRAVFDEEAVAAIRGIGEARDALRMQAADVLEPVLRAAGRYAEVASVLELRLRAQGEPAERARTLRAIAVVAEANLADLERAQSALLRALAEEPADPALHEEIERLADRGGTAGWERYADALHERAGATFDAVVAADLFERLGRIAETRLDDPPRAARAYLAAAERRGDDGVLLAALDRLFSRLGDSRRLADVLERRIAVETERRAQADLAYRLGTIQLRDFGQKAQGLATFRLALERVPEHTASREALTSLLGDEALFEDAFEALEFVYRATGRSEEVAALYERRVARAPSLSDRTRARLELARVLEETVGDRSRAQRVVQSALAEDPSDEDVLRELERLAAANAAWRDAAEAMSNALDAANDLPAMTRMDLWIRLAGWRRDPLGDARLAEEAYTRALALDPENLDVLRALEAVQRAPGHERALVQTLRSRARLEADAKTRRELLREAKSLAEEPVHDPDLAEAALRQLVAEDEQDGWALEELTRLRAAAGDHAEVASLLLRRAELARSRTDAAVLRHEAARVYVERLNDPVRAIALYEEILDDDPSDATAAAALRALYARAGRDRDLRRLLLRLIDVSTAVSERSALRLELARLQAENFRAPEDAVDTLRAVLDEDGSNADAVLLLSQLYELTGRDNELADLLRVQLDAARDRGDANAEVALLMRLGEVQERRLADVPGAQATYERIVERDPTHRPALEAIARIAEARDEWDKAAAALARLVEGTSDGSGVGYVLRLAHAREKLGDGPGVEDALRRGLQFESSNKGLRAMLRARLERNGKWEELARLLVGDADLLAAATASVTGTVVAAAGAGAVATPGTGTALAGAAVPGRPITTQTLMMPSGPSQPPPDVAGSGSPAGGGPTSLGPAPVAPTSGGSAAEPDRASASMASAGRASLPPPRASSGPAGRPSLAPGAARGSVVPAPPPVPPEIAEQVAVLRTAAEIWLNRLGNPEQAIPILERAARLVPQDRDLLLVLCDAYNGVQRGRDAAHVLERVIASFGTRRTKELAVYHHRLARAFSQLGDKQLALSQLDMAFKIDPGSVGVLRDLGVLAFEANDLERAQKTFRALLLQRLDATTGISKGEVFCYLGEISERQGDRPKAIQMFERAVENDPALARARARLTELKA